MPRLVLELTQSEYDAFTWKVNAENEEVREAFAETGEIDTDPPATIETWAIDHLRRVVGLDDRPACLVRKLSQSKSPLT